MLIKKTNIWQTLIHIFLWILFYGLLLYPFVSEGRLVPPDLYLRLFLATIFFYFNYYYLIPKVLLKKKTWLYITIVVLLIGSFIILMDIIAKNFFADFNHLLPDNTYSVEQREFRKIFMSAITLGIPFIVSSLLRIYIEWNKNEDLRKVIENEKVNSELQFLKTQLNPHFLFNSLNAIYSLSVKKSDKASEAIINLSELMRYMLYEADKDLVLLTREIEYIKNYVQLQRLRLSDSKNVILKISGEHSRVAMPPLLFISFIENAFKYGTDFKGITNVKINLTIFPNAIHFIIINKIGSFKKEEDSSGVGLQNVRNRLNLLYPDSHDLIVENDGESYCVRLTIKI
ncbi:histidine kinase [Cellulophaga baltica]|uniref:sensor histidine kinase n=1 Tax=Cellulophaga TaxID=104264 RepID=UPI001C0732E7|nr:MULTISPECIES: histidine kinase [Cellulophaga]MBU2997278.1 histidine kinase [Cellulophaga baltica]MDO6768676.1 histidine kinase [Cellulophaga sp. 1_MG-2023]